MTAFRVAAGLAALLLVAAGALSCVRRRTHRFLGLLWVGVGLALAVPALRPDWFGGPGAAACETRIRLALGLLSLLVLLITLETVRRFAMRESYALLWVGTGFAILVFTIYPKAVAWLVALTGMHYVSAVVVFVFAFLLLVAFHFSLELSEAREDRKRLAQHGALLEARVAELERRLAGKNP